MKLFYPTIIHQENETYWCEFPDLVGCQTYGNTLYEVIANAKEAMEGYCLQMLEDGEKLPMPTDLKTITTDKDCVTSLVYTDLTPYLNKNKAVKKTLTIPQWLNDLAIENGVNFSKVLQDALMQQLNV